MVTTTQKTTQATAPASATQPLVRAEVIAHHFNVHKRTVALWAQAGTIPCIRIGGILRFNLAEVLGVVQ